MYFYLFLYVYVIIFDGTVFTDLNRALLMNLKRWFVEKNKTIRSHIVSCPMSNTLTVYLRLIYDFTPRGPLDM